MTAAPPALPSPGASPRPTPSSSASGRWWAPGSSAPSRPAARAGRARWLLAGARASPRSSRSATRPSSAQLAAQYPTSGGTYVYGRERLGPWWGFVAGLGLRHRQDRELRGHGARRSRPTSCPVALAEARRRRAPSSRSRPSTTADHAHGAAHPRHRRRRPRRCSPWSLAGRRGARWRGAPGTRPRSRAVGGVGGVLQGAATPLLRLRRLRAHRHARRGGRRPGPHHPAGDPRRLRRRRAALRRHGRRAPPRARRRRRSPSSAAPLRDAAATVAVRRVAAAARRGRPLPRPRSARCSPSSPASGARPSRWRAKATCPGGSPPCTSGMPCRTSPRSPSPPSSACSSSLTDLRAPSASRRSAC